MSSLLRGEITQVFSVGLYSARPITILSWMAMAVISVKRRGALTTETEVRCGTGGLWNVKLGLTSRKNNILGHCTPLGRQELQYRSVKNSLLAGISSRTHLCITVRTISMDHLVITIRIIIG